MAQERKRLVSRGSGIALIAALALGALLLWKGTRAGANSPVVGAPEARDDRPAPSSRPTLGEPGAGAEVRAVDLSSSLRVEVQRSPDGPHEPLRSGRMETRVGDRVLDLDVRDGRVTLPVGQDAPPPILSIADATGAPLPFCLDAGAARVRCYGYPGVFVRVEGSDAAEPPAVEALGFSGDPNLETSFLVPPSRKHVSALSVDAGAPAYVEAVGPESPFYLLRPEEGAWSRFEAAEHPVGSTITLPDRPSGSVVFAAVDASYPHPPRLIVRSASSGRNVMSPRFGAEVQDPILGFPVGDFDAYLTLASTDSPTSALTAIARFSVSAGQTSYVHLEPLEDAADEGVGHLSGVLQFASWELVQPWYERYGLRLNVESLSAPDSVAFRSIDRRRKRMPVQLMQVLRAPESGDPSWAWDAGEYPAGDYRMHVEPLRAWFDFPVRPGESTVLEDPIPPLAVAVLEFRPALEEGKVPGFLLSLPEEWGPGLRMNSSLELATHPSGLPMLIAPPGHYRLSFRWGTEQESVPLDLDPGWNHVPLELEPVRTFVLAFVDGSGHPLDVPPTTWRSISVVDSGSGDVQSVVPRHVRAKGESAWSEALVALPEGGAVTIRGLSTIGFSRDELEVHATEGERRVLVQE